MKRFVKKIILFVLIIGAPLLTVNQMYKNTNFYLSMNELYWIKVYPQEIELLNLGNSHEMNAIRMFDKYRGVSHNFATSSQPFYYDYQILKNLEGSIAENAIVLIPISLFDWYYNYQELFLEDTASYNKRYYRVLPASSMLYYNFEDDVRYHFLPVITAKENLKYIVEDVDLPRKETANYYTNPNGVRSNADWKYESWMNYVMKLEEDIKQENEKWFRKMIDLCYERGYRPVVISTPIPYTLTEKFSAEFLAEFQETNESVVAEYPGLLFLDYSQDTEFTENLMYFQDADHMNTYGADAYSERLLLDLVRLGYLMEEDLY